MSLKFSNWDTEAIFKCAISNKGFIQAIKAVYHQGELTVDRIKSLVRIIFKDDLQKEKVSVDHINIKWSEIISAIEEQAQ